MTLCLDFDFAASQPAGFLSILRGAARKNLVVIHAGKRHHFHHLQASVTSQSNLITFDATDVLLLCAGSAPR
jgi:hypothetical protein